ncbi:MAG TPA: orotate phosphoribosyltransferase [Thermoanaerobaculia bacterium]|nr:orotate phosphoribosyltransferase [Thermoanaerobaculia bacterium]
MRLSESLDRRELMDLLSASGALKRGHFELSSGRHSSAYVQCALLLEDPARAERVGRALGQRLEDREIEAVVSPALGGVLIGYEVARYLAVPFRFAERVNGVMSLRRGFESKAGERTAIVEDVITTGLSTRETADVVRKSGGEIVAIGAIIDRRANRATPLEVPLLSLLQLDLPTFEPASCPLCSQGSAAEKPGSRPSQGSDQESGSQPSASR